MRKLFVTVSILLFIIACNKSTAPLPEPFKERDQNVNQMFLPLSKPWQAGDTTGNYIADMLFDEAQTFDRNDSNGGAPLAAGNWSTWLTDSRDTHIYAIRYTGSVALVDTFIYSWNWYGGTMYCYSINPVIAGQQIWEVYDTTARKLYSRIYADNPARIYINCTVILPSPAALREAINYCIFKMQTNALYFRRQGI